MADKKITELPNATLPILGSGSRLELVQGGINVQTDPDNIGGGTVPDADATTKGIAKLYTDVAAQNTDGAPDQNAVFDALALKADFLITYRTETATHDLDATDLANINLGEQLMILLNIAVAGDLELPTNANQAFPVGTVIGWQQYGAGQITIVPLSGVTMRSPNNANKSFAQYSKGYIEKIGTDEWVLSGDITV